MTTANRHRVGLERFGPVEIRRELETTSALLSSIDKEVSSSTADSLFKSKWGDLRRDWLEFYQGKLGPAGIISHLRDSTFDRAAAFRREALKFRYALLKAQPTLEGPAALAPDKGGVDGGPHLPKVPNINLPKLPDIDLPTFPWRTLVYGGAAVAGGVLLLRIVAGPRQRR
jgi:hypothetical protein